MIIGDKYIVTEVNYQYRSWCKPGDIIEVIKPIINYDNGRITMWDIKSYSSNQVFHPGTFRVGEFFFDGCKPYYRDKNLNEILNV